MKQIVPAFRVRRVSLDITSTNFWECSTRTLARNVLQFSLFHAVLLLIAQQRVAQVRSLRGKKTNPTEHSRGYQGLKAYHVIS